VIFFASSAPGHSSLVILPPGDLGRRRRCVFLVSLRRPSAGTALWGSSSAPQHGGASRSVALFRGASSSASWTARSAKQGRGGAKQGGRDAATAFRGKPRSGGVVRASLSEPEWEGSRQLQQLLVEQVRVQIGEVQVQQVVDAESQRLRSLVRDGMGRDLDRIATRAMKGADDMTHRVRPTPTHRGGRLPPTGGARGGGGLLRWTQLGACSGEPLVRPWLRRGSCACTSPRAPRSCLVAGLRC